MSDGGGARRWAPRVLLCLALAAALFALRCAAGAVAKLDDWIGFATGEPPSDTRVVVLVPGVTGSILSDGDGTVQWGRGLNLLRPHDGSYALARPLAAGGGAPALEASGVIDTIRLAGVIRKPVYGPLLHGLEAIGYRRGELASPRATDTLFAFAWDWRESQADGAAKLAAALDSVRQARGVDVLRVALVCQSSGAHLCRFFTKYGGASLEEVEAGRARPPARVDVTTVVLVGSSNGGSLRILRELDRGRRYVPLVGRRSRPETLFTFPSLYEDLPAYRRDLFVSAAGEPLDVDLYDAQSWVRLRWSAFGDDASRRLARTGTPTAFGTEAERLEFLRTTLDRAQRFQRALHADVGWARSPSYHLIQGKSDPKTPARAALLPDGELLFSGDAEVERDPRLRAITGADGDGHATVESQQWLSPEETAAVRATVYVPGPHFEMILTPETAAAVAAALRE